MLHRKEPSCCGLALVALAGCLLAAPASPAAAEDAEASDEIPYRSPNAALLLSLGSSAVTAGMNVYMLFLSNGSLSALGARGYYALLFGLNLSPSAGHLYTGDTWHVVGTGLARAFALGLIVAGLAQGGGTGESLAELGPGDALMWLGSLSWIGLTCYDIIDAPFSAHRFNERAAGDAFELNLSPFALAAPAGRPEAGPALGLSLSGRF